MSQEETLRLLDSIDWITFEQEAFQAVADAVEKYLRSDAGRRGEPLSQAAITTYLLHAETHVSLMTHRALVARGGVFLRGPGAGSAPVVDVVTYTSVADFDLRDFHTRRHLCLAPLRNWDADEESFELAKVCQERYLLAVRDRVLREDVLDRLPRAKRFWLSINSSRDWDDHHVELNDSNSNNLS